eukprot:scaffold2716_cov64-Phaeocystis_antarctica.AAC.8
MVGRASLTVTSGAKVGGLRKRALLARQRRTGALWAVGPGLAGNACLLALAGLIRAGPALVAGALLRDGLDRAGAALDLLRAARRCIKARVSRRALAGAAEIGGAGIRTLLARQRRAGTLWAERAGLTGNARLLALASLVLACRAPVARGHARVWRDRAGAALTRLRRARTASRSRRALQAVVGARHREVELQHRLVLVGAGLARQRGRCALRAVRAGRARPAHQLARRGLEGAGLALDTRAHACVGCDRAGAALGLLGAARWRVVAQPGRCALLDDREAGGGRVRALRARQCRTGTRWAERAGPAGNARPLALAGLIRACRAPVTEGSARGGCNEAGRAFSAVGWVGAPRNRIGLPRSACLARRAAILTAVWVERAGRAWRERLPQARRSLCRTKATGWTARQAACASLGRVVSPGCARNAAILHQAGDADREMCTGRTQEWLNGRSWAVLAAAVALATALVVCLLARVAEAASRALVRAAGEVYSG